MEWELFLLFINSLKSSRALIGDCTLSIHIMRGAGLIDRIQPHWTSAYDGYGMSSLETDVLEMGALVDHIRAEDGEFIHI